MKIKVESFDVRIVINALREMRNKLIEENLYNYIVIPKSPKKAQNSDARESILSRF